MSDHTETENTKVKADLAEGLDRCRDLLLHYKAMMGVPANDMTKIPEEDATGPQEQANT